MAQEYAASEAGPGPCRNGIFKDTKPWRKGPAKKKKKKKKTIVVKDCLIDRNYQEIVGVALRALQNTLNPGS